MQKKRVLYIHKTSSLGGSIVSLLKLVEHLDKKLYEPIILLYDESSSSYISRFKGLGAKVMTLDKKLAPKTSKLDGIRLGNRLERHSFITAHVYRFFKSVYRLLRGDLVRAQRLKQIIVENQIDLVHHNQWGQENIMAAWLAGVPQICHMRALGKMGPLDRWLARSVNTFIYVSSAIAAYYEEQGIPSNKGRTILNGISVDEFMTVQDTKMLRQELGFTPTDILVGSIGRLVEWKGYDFFLKAMAELVPSFPNLKVLIVGRADNTSQGQAYEESLKTLTRSLGLSEVVVFTGFRTDIPRIMALLDVIVHSAVELEPGSRVLIEALATGTPLVASKAGGILDIAEDDVHALLVPPEDVQDIATAVKRLLTDPQLAQRLTKAGRCRVLDCCTVERYAGAVQDVYQAALFRSISSTTQRITEVSNNV